MLHGSYVYSLWDGTQQVFDIDADSLMDKLSDELMSQGDVLKALRDLLRNGVQDRDGKEMPGLKELMQRLKDQRREQLQKYNMDSVVDDLKDRLNEIVKAERDGIRDRLADARERSLAESMNQQLTAEELYTLLEQRSETALHKLDKLPPNVSGLIQELLDYDFMDSNARQMFQDLIESLKSQMAQNMSQDLQGQIGEMSQLEQSRLAEMMYALNQMIKNKLSGKDPQFDEFMSEFGDMFGSTPPQDFDALMEFLQNQLAQSQSLLESMSSESRSELEDAMNAALGQGLLRAMAEFAELLGQLMPVDDIRRQYPFLGEDSLTMEQAMEMMNQFQNLDKLEMMLQEAMRTGDLSEIDPDYLAELLGEDARKTFEDMNQLLKLLKDAGYITAGETPELTARGMRKIGQKALREVFSELKKDRLGGHETDTRGAGGDFLGDTKSYEFGDPFQLDLQATLKNAVLRGGASVPVKMTPEDFEIHRNEHMTRSATVVLLDQSRSMGMFNNFNAAKKVTLALFALIRTQYPRDTLHVIGFSDYAYEIKEQEITKVNWNAWRSGTNLQHGLMLARKKLADEKGSTRQILLITDGEPTAHLENGQAYFDYPTSYRTELETFKEIKRCTREGIIINTFMLENNYQVVNFVDRLTRINRGRAFYSSSDSLGQYVLVDYLNNRKKRVTT
ncbi:MAG: VWA domain-containing protein [Chloroflexota bacterium]|nr:VWA domain-containing protein [Chloroflexota bacterium]